MQCERSHSWKIFFSLLSIFLCFWVLLGLLLPVAHAETLSSDYGIVTVRETWQNITVKSGYMLGLYTKDDRVITTNLLISNPDYGVKIALSDSTSNLRLYINGRTISYNSGEITLSASTLSGFENTDTPIYISSDSATNSTYHICSYGSFAVVEEQEDPGWLESVGNWFSGLGDNISNTFGNIGDALGSLFDDLWLKIKEFFGNLFQPITDFMNGFFGFIARFDSISDWLDSIGKYMDMTQPFKPVYDFFNSIDNSVFAVLAEMWTWPILGDLLMAFVVILVIGGVFMLFVTV